VSSVIGNVTAESRPRRAQQPHLRPIRLNFPPQARQLQRASTRKIGIVERADWLSNDAVEAPNQTDLILRHSLTIVREWHFGKMPPLRFSAVNKDIAGDELQETKAVIASTTIFLVLRQLGP
jgi:hypothetical protein